MSIAILAVVIAILVLIIADQWEFPDDVSARELPIDPLERKPCEHCGSTEGGHMVITDVNIVEFERSEQLTNEQIKEVAEKILPDSKMENSVFVKRENGTLRYQATMKRYLSCRSIGRQ